MKKKKKKKTWPLGSRAIKFIQKSYSSELGWNFNGKYAKPVCSGEGYMNIMVLLCFFFFFFFFCCFFFLRQFKEL